MMLITVIEYSGSRYAVEPRVFSAHGQPVTVTRVISTWLEEEYGGTGSRKQVWNVEGDDGRQYTLVHNLEAGFWEMPEP